MDTQYIVVEFGKRFLGYLNDIKELSKVNIYRDDHSIGQNCG
jgi:hypothetical protein